MDPSELHDDGFSSFFLDYKYPTKKINSEFTSSPVLLPLMRQPCSTPPNTSMSLSTTSTLFSSSTLSSSNLTSFISATLTPAQATRTLVLKRKLFDNNEEELKAAIASISVEERIDLQEIEDFAVFFKKQRTQYGCTQNDIGLALGRKYGTEFSQTTISRFEALNLSFKNMSKLRPLLREWLADVETALAQGISMNEFLQRPPVTPPLKSSIEQAKKEGRHRKRRTFIDELQSVKLTEEFAKNNRPSPNQFSDMAERLRLDKNVIRIWYSNHRQKLRKIEDERLTLHMEKSENEQ